MELSRQRQYLQAMGVQAWELRSAPAQVVASPEIGQPEVREPVVPEDKTPNVEPADISHLDWEGLRSTVSACTACGLHEQRTQTVFGVGHRQADWMLVGEAPGADEDRLGEPFVGRAGKLLDAILKAVGLSRETVYIANVVKCRPPGNRNPQVSEAAACREFLMRQIELVQPKLILALGGVAAHNLLQTDDRVGQMRGKIHHLGDIPLVVTYHPAYLLRSPLEKSKVWQDLRFALEVTDSEGAE